MAENKLSIEIDATVQGAVKGVDAVTHALAEVPAAANKASAGLKTFETSASKLGTGVKKGANEAAQALTNVGRVAQDLPFGFIGIQNNLNPLL